MRKSQQPCDKNGLKISILKDFPMDENTLKAESKPTPKRAPRSKSSKAVTQEKTTSTRKPAKPRTRANLQKNTTEITQDIIQNEDKNKSVEEKKPRTNTRGRTKKSTSNVDVPNDDVNILNSDGLDNSTMVDKPAENKANTKKPTKRVGRPTKKKVSNVNGEGENIQHPVTKDISQEISQDSTPNEATDAEAHDSEHSETENTPKSRRGRRGGRGKRGKKRTTKLDDVENIENEDSSAQRPKVSAITSVVAGKPGRARATVGKKIAATSKRRTMFISAVSGEQVEVALTEEGLVHEYYLEMLHQAKSKGNIYKGVVHNVDTNLQAAFINYGGGKNGFLQIDEIHPEYYQSHHEVVKGKKYPPIQQVIKPGQEILVQVVKEPTGNKGAFLTTWLSLAGRFLVLTPGQEQIGISRKVDSDEERNRLRELMTGIEPGVGLGVIVRTVSAGTSKTNLKNDLQYLKRVWREIRKRGVNEAAPLLVYQEPKLAERAIRDYLTDDVHEVWVDNAEMAENLREIIALLFPRKKDLVRVHSDVRQTLWERFTIQRQLEQIYSREVVLPSGGRLVFDQTEALMAIDINSGKISGKGNFAAMAYKTNLEAAESIARHLKLRDIGGQIVIDFIEMRDKNHVREVEKTLRTAMKTDRARHDVGRISSFGLLEIVRQRTASSALAITMEPCPHCRGTGMRRNLEWQALQALREMMRQGRATQADNFAFETSAELALYLLNRKRRRIGEIEEQLEKSIEVRIRA